MAKSDGYLKNITKVQKTRILPLRWIGNLCGEFAGNHLLMAVYLDEDGNWGLHYKYHAKMYKILNKPYTWWGTYYTVDLDG
jgi:hypothetical protein